MYTWTVGSCETAAYNLGLAVAVRWLGVTSKDLRVKYPLPTVESLLAELLSKPWIRSSLGVQNVLQAMLEGAGGIEDIGDELGGIVLENIRGKHYIIL